ncbi:hypothetical protein [Actinophytocola sp. NPDC049390]|uniref:hypothetical protein n=1 Tax=Actinophytocola sp. NPDC049390 TaxID=3363894 RepID=UPI0037BDFA3B
MSWQERLRDLGDKLARGEITTADYRKVSEAILAEADAEAAADTQATDRPRVHIPRSAAWEAPSGEMTQIVGTQDATTLVNPSISDLSDEPGDATT